MRRVHLFLGLGGIALLASAVLVLQTVQSPRNDTVPVEAEEQAGSSASKDLVTPRHASTDNARGVVSARMPEPVRDDPCASLAADLEAERAARAAGEQEVARLRRELADLTRDLNALRFPESTPYGAFLASPEAEDITDPDLRAAFKAMLDEYPVMLRPGEATWIAEHSVKKDSGAYAHPNEKMLVFFLGPERLTAEMPLDKLFEDLLWNEDYGPALQAALPREKREELRVKLHGLLEKSEDPEEIAWLLERFPSFFN